MWSQIILLLLQGRPMVYSQWWGIHPHYGKLPWAEVLHDPHKITTSAPIFLNGTEYTIPPSWETPDFRLPEPPWVPWREDFYIEENRPYRVSPFLKQINKYNYRRKIENPYQSGCICCTVFKRLTPLAGCALITTRHALTTATSTELILKRYRKRKTLENILGLWYDINTDVWNSSMYHTPARIHYHPLYQLPELTNRSHPLPCMHDLAVWAMTYRFIASHHHNAMTAVFCKRGVSERYEYAPGTPGYFHMLFIVGFQYVWLNNRVPAPWYKYLTRVRLGKEEVKEPCPKTEWGWFTCIKSDKYAKLGLDSGAALQISHENKGWRSDGLIGLNAFSMRLRSLEINNYFTVLDTHKNVDFLYSAYMGRLPYQYLDYRFYNTQWKAPRVKPWHYVEWKYEMPWQPTDAFMPFW